MEPLYYINRGQDQDSSKLEIAPKQKLQSHFQVKQPQFFCKQGHRILFVCINRLCIHPAFECSLCSNNHQSCVKFQVDNFYKFFMTNVENEKNSFKFICQKQRQLISSILKSQQTLAESIIYCNYEQNSKVLIKDMFYKRQVQKYYGKDMQHFKEQLQGCLAPENTKRNYISESYKSFQSYMTDSIRIYLENSYKSRVRSFIITQSHQLQFIKASLQEIKEKPFLKLLYRASENGFSASEFHKKCDNVEHTFTLIRTEFNKTIAAYTPLKWNSTANCVYAADTSNKSFLLQVDLKQKMALTQPQKAILCNSNSGPTFGSGCDIFIADKCNVNSNSGANFPTSYNFASKPYAKLPATWSTFSGSATGSFFRVLEYEVFKVQFGQPFNLVQFGRPFSLINNNNSNNNCNVM